MSEAWATAIVSVLIGVALLTVPGGIVVMAGWGVRSLRHWLLAPAISVALVAGSATIAALIGLRWSLFAVTMVTLICAAVALLVRRSFRLSAPEPPAPASGWRPWVCTLAGLAAAFVAIALQLTSVFGNPQNVSQTFDNVVHLNAIRLALDSGDASIFGIGGTSDIPWYPNGWHSIVTLVAQLGGGSVPLAVNAANIALFAFAWPASALALSATVFRERPAALAATAALSTGFGAFPLLLLDFGVLYPNAAAYAILPAAIAGVWLLLSSLKTDLLRHSLLLVLLVSGTAMAHPNALLALYAVTLPTLAWHLIGRARAATTRRDRWIPAIWILALLVLGAVLWRGARTNAEMSGWGSWQSTAQAFGEAALVAPRGYPLTTVSAALMLIGIAAIIRRPSRWLQVGPPFVAGAFLFIVVSGLPIGTRLRDLLMNPWYNDSYRLAALLPAVGIPVAVVGALVVVELLSRALRRTRTPATAAGVVTAIAVFALFTVAAGPNVTHVMEDARDSYALTEDAALLTSDEAALLDRLDETTPEDTLLIVNPWTGGSLAFALAGREVTALHIFGERSADEEFLDANLINIDSDPLVCDAVGRVGAEYVLDFGTQNVFKRPESGLERAGLNDLTPSAHLVLVDAEGQSARLFRIEGC